MRPCCPALTVTSCSPHYRHPREWVGTISSPVVRGEGSQTLRPEGGCPGHSREVGNQGLDMRSDPWPLRVLGPMRGVFSISQLPRTAGQWPRQSQSSAALGHTYIPLSPLKSGGHRQEETSDNATTKPC